jgi:hypothetical protein
MKNFTVLENDVDLTEIWRRASDAGFSDIEVAVFSTESCRVSLSEFEDLIAGGPPLDAYGDLLRGFLSGHQMFFLTKDDPATPDSRQRTGLKGEIAVSLERDTVRVHDPVRGRATIRNVGAAVWLPGTTKVGGVNLGVHLRTSDGQPIEVDFGRVRLEHGTEPGGIQTVDFTLASPPQGDYLLEFDLVSEGVGWFEVIGSATATVAISIEG